MPFDGTELPLDSIARFKAWVDTQPSGKLYDYVAPCRCAFALFLQAQGYPDASCGPGRYSLGSRGKEIAMAEGLDAALAGPKASFGRETFGALSKRLAALL